MKCEASCHRTILLSYTNLCSVLDRGTVPKSSGGKAQEHTRTDIAELPKSWCSRFEVAKVTARSMDRHFTVSSPTLKRCEHQNEICEVSGGWFAGSEVARCTSWVQDFVELIE